MFYPADAVYISGGSIVGILLLVLVILLIIYLARRV